MEIVGIGLHWNSTEEIDKLRESCEYRMRFCFISYISYFPHLPPSEASTSDDVWGTRGRRIGS
jgi:hypothetical protein